jgi:hypothetical protein
MSDLKFKGTIFTDDDKSYTEYVKFSIQASKEDNENIPEVFFNEKGNLHRLDGPAIIWHDEEDFREFWVDGTSYDDYDDYLIAVENYKNKD